MKHIKLIVALGLIPLCIFIGSYLPIGGGSAAILGGILGFILCCMLIGFGRRRKSGFWLGAETLDEQHQVYNNLNNQEIDKMLSSVREAHTEDQIRHQIDHRF